MKWMKSGMKWLFGLLFVLAGINHFWNPAVYVKIMPPYLPWHLPLVIISGVFEVLLGVLLLIPRTAPGAAWGSIALLIAVFPANVHMAMHVEQFPGISPTMLWLRLPLQGLLIAWAYWFTLPASAAPKP